MRETPVLLVLLFCLFREWVPGESGGIREDDIDPEGSVGRGSRVRELDEDTAMTHRQTDSQTTTRDIWTELRALRHGGGPESSAEVHLGAGG